MNQSNTDSAKKKALELAVAHIQKQFGDGAIMALGKHSSAQGLSVIKTGSVSLDLALGIGNKGNELHLVTKQPTIRSARLKNLVNHALRKPVQKVVRSVQVRFVVTPPHFFESGTALLLITQVILLDLALNLATGRKE